MTSSDVERRGMRAQNFMADLHNYARMVWPRMAEFHMVTGGGGRSIFLGVSHAHIPMGRGPQRPHNWTPTYAKTVWPTATNFGTVTYMGKSVFLGVSHVPIPRGGAPASPHFGTCYMCAHTMRNHNQILHGGQTRCEANFYTVDHECWRAIRLR